jgi:uncharacterized protein YqeY
VSIKEEMSAELKDAMRSGDTRRRDVIRLIETEVSVARAAPGFFGEVDDDLYRAVIGGFVKRMGKAATEYRAMGERGAEMAEKLEFEVDYLGRWLPTKLDEAATRQLVRQVIAELGVEADVKAAGRVTGQVMSRRKGELDGAMVSRLVGELLSGAEGG